jgi:hypothetical protein
MFIFGLFLGGQEDKPILSHGILYRLCRLCAADVEGKYHVREYDNIPHGKQWEFMRNGGDSPSQLLCQDHLRVENRST